MRLSFAITVPLFLVTACGPMDLRSRYASNSSCDTALAYMTSNTGGEIGMGDSPTGFKGVALAQSFQLSEDTSVSRASVLLSRVGFATPTNDTLQLTLESDASGQPGGSVIARSSSISPVKVSDVQTSPRYQTFLFDTDAPLKAGTRYWIRLSASYSPSSQNFIRWHGNIVPGSEYADGEALYKLNISSSPSFWSRELMGQVTDLAFSLENNCVY